MGNSTNKSVADNEKKKDHAGFGEKDHKHDDDRERTATEKERRSAEDVTEAPRQ